MMLIAFSPCFPVLQALLWAPSPRFWFLCSSFALGGLAMKGLRLPGLKSDVHSTCWFSKQLCPQKKNQDKPLTLSSRRNKKGGRGGKCGWGGVEPELSDSISLSLSFSLTTYLSLSYPKHIIFSFSPCFCLIEPNHSNIYESHSLCMTCGGEGAQSKQSESSSICHFSRMYSSHVSDPRLLQSLTFIAA